MQTLTNVHKQSCIFLWLNLKYTARGQHVYDLHLTSRWSILFCSSAHTVLQQECNQIQHECLINAVELLKQSTIVGTLPSQVAGEVQVVPSSWKHSHLSVTPQIRSG